MIKDIITQNIYFGLALTLIAFYIAVSISKRYKLIILNPLLVSILLVIVVLVTGKIDYENYNEGAKYISFLLTPTTVALAIPLYENLAILKENFTAILVGIVTGTLSSAFTILPLCVLLGLDKVDYITLLPKSITTAVGIFLSEDFGGLVPVTVISIVMAGISGVVLSDLVLKIFKIKSPIAQGIALGSSAHAMGTSKAFTLGELQGAISSLSLAVSGILTAIIFSFLVNIY